MNPQKQMLTSTFELSKGKKWANEESGGDDFEETPPTTDTQDGIDQEAIMYATNIIPENPEKDASANQDQGP